MYVGVIREEGVVVSELVNQYKAQKKSFHAADLKSISSSDERAEAILIFRNKTQPLLNEIATESYMWRAGAHIARGRTVMDLIHNAVFVPGRMTGVSITELDVDIYRDHMHVRGTYSPTATLSKNVQSVFKFEFVAYPVE